jgi:hypothetical protein
VEKREPVHLLARIRTAPNPIALTLHFDEPQPASLARHRDQIGIGERDTYRPHSLTFPSQPLANGTVGKRDASDAEDSLAVREYGGSRGFAFVLVEEARAFV